MPTSSIVGVHYTLMWRPKSPDFGIPTSGAVGLQHTSGSSQRGSRAHPPFPPGRGIMGKIRDMHALRARISLILPSSLMFAAEM
jgi:hypothetical protein